MFVFSQRPPSYPCVQGGDKSKEAWKMEIKFLPLRAGGRRLDRQGPTALRFPTPACRGETDDDTPSFATTSSYPCVQGGDWVTHIGRRALYFLPLRAGGRHQDRRSLEHRRLPTPACRGETPFGNQRILFNKNHSPKTTNFSPRDKRLSTLVLNQFNPHVFDRKSLIFTVAPNIKPRLAGSRNHTNGRAVCSSNFAPDSLEIKGREAPYEHPGRNLQEKPL